MTASRSSTCATCLARVRRCSKSCRTAPMGWFLGIRGQRNLRPRRSQRPATRMPMLTPMRTLNRKRLTLRPRPNPPLWRATCPENPSPGAIPTGARGDDKRGGAAPTRKVRKRPLIGSVAPWSNGRTLAVTRGEVRVRIPAGLPRPNEWTDTPARAPVRIKTPGSSPEAMTTQANIADSALIFQVQLRADPMTDRARHEHPFP
jgi:hypothetical protein